MKLNFLVDKNISQKYFTYIILKSADDNGDLDLTILKNNYGIDKNLSEKDYKAITDLRELISIVKEDFKEKNIIENFAKSLSNQPSKNWAELEEKLSGMFSTIFLNEKEIIQKQKDFFVNHGNLELLSSIEKIFDTSLEKVNVYLTPGGFPRFSTGLALNLKVNIKNNLEPTVFVASSNTCDENYHLIESTIIHEVSHLIENNSKCSHVAKKHVMSSDIMKYKPEGTGPRHFISESIITAIAGNKNSYHVQKYYLNNYVPYSSPDNPTLYDTYRKIASLILPILTPYIENEVILDDDFFREITKRY